MSDKKIHELPILDINIPSQIGNDSDTFPFVRLLGNGAYLNARSTMSSFLQKIVGSQYFQKQLSNLGLGGNPLFSTVNNANISSTLSLEFNFSTPTYLIKLWYAYDQLNGTNFTANYYNPNFNITSGGVTTTNASQLAFFNATNTDIEASTIPSNRPYLASYYSSTIGTKTFNIETSYLSLEPVSYWVLSIASPIGVIIGNNATLPANDSNGALAQITQTSSYLDGAHFINAYIKSNSSITSPSSIQWVKTAGNKSLSLSNVVSNNSNTSAPNPAYDLVTTNGTGTPARWNPTISTQFNVTITPSTFSLPSGSLQWLSNNQDVSGKNSFPTSTITWIVPIYYFKSASSTVSGLPGSFTRLFQTYISGTICNFGGGNQYNVIMYPTSLGTLTTVQEGTSPVGNINGVYSSSTATLVIDGNISTNYTIWVSKSPTAQAIVTKFT